MENEKYELAIIGGGPAGTTAAVYAARKKLRSVIITDDWGGQSNVSEDIQNWIGFPHISGKELGQKFKEHVEEYADDILDIKYPSLVQGVEEKDGLFYLSLSSGETLVAENLFLGLGSKRRKLQAKGADEFEHKGLTYCATCDGPIFAGKDVAVIGGGNAGFESAAQLLAYVNSVTLLEYSDKFKADPSTVEKLMQNPKFKAITNAEVTEVFGNTFVEGLKYKDRASGEEKTLEVQGIFVEIGAVPNTELVKDLLELTEYGQIKIDPWTQKTSHSRIWAAGDCTNILYHQNNIASGDAVKALEDIYKTLRA